MSDRASGKLLLLLLLLLLLWLVAVAPWDPTLADLDMRSRDHDSMLPKTVRGAWRKNLLVLPQSTIRRKRPLFLVMKKQPICTRLDESKRRTPAR